MSDGGRAGAEDACCSDTYGEGRAEIYDGLHPPHDEAAVKHLAGRG